MNWYVNALYDYLKFSGRSSRKEFCVFIVLDICFLFFAVLIDQKFDLMYLLADVKIGLVSSLYLWFTFMPRLALVVRRMHDIGLSASYLLFVFVPFYGHYFLINSFLKEGSDAYNKYGASPADQPFKDTSVYFNAESEYIVD